MVTLRLPFRLYVRPTVRRDTGSCTATCPWTALRTHYPFGALRAESHIIHGVSADEHHRGNAVRENGERLLLISIE